MFTRLPDAAAPPVTVVVDGVEVEARVGDTVAAALLASGRLAVRVTRSGAPRGPFCMIGMCFDCLVTVDGVANQQACMVAVASGMRIETGGRAPAAPEAEP